MPKIIRINAGVPQVMDDDWELVRAAELASACEPHRKIVPLSYFRSMLEEHRPSNIQAVWISPDDDFESLVPELRSMKVIAVDFPTFRDGRGYSVATLLRSRYQWDGELRAIGDVLRDQLNYMRRCGFDSFAVRADKDIDDAIKSFNHYSVKYQGAVDDPLPLFRRRGGL
ncbi:DUF934 domain-containing protein [Noviherbaspirillum saxi]|uniref:DUF934 domain-containing protein n=1 Tax=Noviherbaspirillum saxi TaxID=2320863 RepID=A0A3A3FKC1_9BURK|nr:DUF934 domain-containing protein [Noviherbaspirillum saxi]RJF95161.1 DUF934 domain-containing protein [Noviherbaspirillum saxi]